MVLNIRQKQTEAVLKMLNLNTSQVSTKDPGEMYKVLVLDKFSKDVIAPLLRVNDLRKNGVTLHLALEADRQPIPDVPAVYLMQPSQQNIDRVLQDAAKGLYETCHLNFTSTIPMRLVENLAAGAVKGGCLQRVGKLYDQYLAFIALEPSLFSLGLPESYVELNDPQARDSQIEAAVHNIVDGLFSVCVTLGVMPVIRCPKGGAAEHVAMLLDQKLRDALKARNNLFSEGVLGLSSSLTRPLLCLFDRNFDLSSMVEHTWSYKPMVQDVLGMKLNKITLVSEPGPGPGSAAAGAKRSYDVDDRDFFWEACGSHPFPKVAEEVETQLQRYKAAVDEINKKTEAGQAEGAYDPDELFRKNTQNLMAAVSSLPELQEQKKTLDKHTNLATALLSSIKARALDQFYHLGEDLLSGKLDLQAVLKLINGAKGGAMDKLRIALVYLLACDGLPSDSDFGDLEGCLKASQVDTRPLAYVRTLKRNNLTGSSRGAADGLGGLASQTNLLDWADKALGATGLTKSVKTLLASSRQPPITLAVEALAEGKQGTSEFDGYAVFDPKAAPGRSGLERAKGPFKDVLVFMIGGGNYLERETLMTWGSRMQPPKQLVYGATDILTPEDFIGQLTELAKRSGLA